MTDTRRTGLKLEDYVRELCEHHTHAEHYTIRRAGEWTGLDHRTDVPPLIVQLWAGDIPSNSTEEGPRPGFRSKPTARLDALDTAVRIDLAAARWVRDLGEDDPADTVDTNTWQVRRGSGTIACIRLLHGLSASVDPVTRREIMHDVRRWWVQARVVTGWDSAAWTPDNTCPQCGERGTLKVRLGDRIGMCTSDACRATWDTETIGLLADHIRAESDAERVPRPPRSACYCPWPKPIVADLSRLCSGCGSARCHHALQARLLDTILASRGAKMGA